MNVSSAFNGDLESALYSFAFLNTSDGQVHPITGKIVDDHPYKSCHKYAKVSPATPDSDIFDSQLTPSFLARLPLDGGAIHHLDSPAFNLHRLLG